MTVADRIKATIADLTVALDRTPDIDELCFELAARWDRAEAGASPGYLRRNPMRRDPRPPKPPVP